MYFKLSNDMQRAYELHKMGDIKFNYHKTFPFQPINLHLNRLEYFNHP